jgi:hypothetical protein
VNIIFDKSGTDDKEIRSRVILWSKEIRKERKLNIKNALIKSSYIVWC